MKTKSALSTTTIGQRLYSIRKHRHLTVQEASKLTGVSWVNLNRYERDQSRPTTKFLKALCEGYQVSSDYLLFGVRTEELEKAGWTATDPQLTRMMERLVAAMTSDDPDMRGWAIVQFTNAFQMEI